MTIYRKTDGSPLSYDRLMDIQSKKYRKPAVRMPKLYIPHSALSAEKYVADFDRGNNLKAVKYTWESPCAHVGYVELPLIEELEQEFAMAA